MGIVNILQTFLYIYILCVLIWALLSWLPMVLPELASNTYVRQLQRFLDSVVLPYVGLFRFIKPMRFGNALIDLSSLVAILLLVYGGPYILSLLH